MLARISTLLCLVAVLLAGSCEYYGRTAPEDVPDSCKAYMACMEETIQGQGLEPFPMTEEEFELVQRYFDPEQGECWLYGDLVDDCSRACKAFEINNCPGTTGCDELCDARRDEVAAEEGAGLE